MIIIKKILLFFSLFFLFNTLEIDSNSDKALLYDKNLLYEESYHDIYFNKINSNELEKIINKLNINVLSYIIDNKKYYANNIVDLLYKYINQKSLKDKIYFEHNGILIDGISLKCTNEVLIELEKYLNIY